MRRHRGRVGLMATALVGVLVSGASAGIVTERSASVLVFPKVVANGTRDTIIQITNTSNSMVHAHCFYVNAAPTFQGLPPDPILNPPLWQEIDFDIWLTKQQPTYWRVSTGRQDNYAQGIDPPCTFSPLNLDCPNAGFDPGAVPPVVEDFIGELKCVETDQTGAPISGNHLKGEATIVTYDVCNPLDSICTVGGNSCTAECSSDFDTAKYNAVGILGNEFNNGDGVLCLGGQSNDRCPDPEYNGCPDTWILNHFAWEAESPTLETGSAVRTSITVVPCTQNFELQNPLLEPGVVTLQLLTYNEFEQVLSASTQFVCWEDYNLPDIGPTQFNVLFPGDTYRQTFIRSTAASSGVLMVATEAHQVAAGGRIGSASFNVHHEGTRPQQDVITIPADQLQ